MRIPLNIFKIISFYTNDRCAVNKNIPNPVKKKKKTVNMERLG